MIKSFNYTVYQGPQSKHLAQHQNYTEVCVVAYVCACIIEAASY